MTKGGLPLWKYFFYWKTGVGWVFGTAGVTGDILILILIIMVICSLPCVRRQGYFEVFYWTHNLFVPWYVFLVLHGTHFWKWFLMSGLLYVVERILRSKWVKLARHGRTYILEGILLPSKVGGDFGARNGHVALNDRPLEKMPYMPLPSYPSFPSRSSI